MKTDMLDNYSDMHIMAPQITGWFDQQPFQSSFEENMRLYYRPFKRSMHYFPMDSVTNDNAITFFTILPRPYTELDSSAKVLMQFVFPLN